MSERNWTKIATKEFNEMDVEGRLQWTELRNIVDRL